MKTMMIYFRKAGVDIRRVTDKFDLHDLRHEVGKVLDFRAAGLST
jgi:hypothetical protein